VALVNPDDPLQLRRAFSAFPTGVTAVAAEVGGTAVGMAVNSFSTVSLVPPLVSICVAHTSTTWPVLRLASRFGINVLGRHQGDACRALSGPRGRRFTGLRWHTTPSGAIVLDGASAWMETSIVQEVPAGDHDIVVLCVHDAAFDLDVAPLVFQGSRFRELVP
jgi:flavin reductase (DIM6/NTAB) family NADH-FMN oxidoreductase RutF